MGKIFKIAIQPQVEQQFKNYDRLMEKFSPANLKSNFGDAYEKHDVGMSLFSLTNKRDELLSSFEEDFPDYVSVLKQTHLWNKIENTGTHRIWLCYQLCNQKLSFTDFIKQVNSILM